MLDTITPMPQPPESIRQTQPAHRDHVLSMIPLIVVGYVLVIVALLILPWPTGQYGEDDVKLVPHIARVICPLPDEVPADAHPTTTVLAFTCYPWDNARPNLPRRLLDLAIYPVMIVGVYLLVTAMQRGTRGSLVALIAFSVIGLSYAGGLALFTAPAISIFGYLLILFGALIAWASFPPESEGPAQKQMELVHDQGEGSVEGDSLPPHDETGIPDAGAQVDAPLA